METSRVLLAFAAASLLTSLSLAVEFHVATNGNNAHPGTSRAPFRTIQRAADVAQPGDTITVHAGTYRERVNPPRGGTSERRRIVYRAGRGERVEIKGSEVVRGWVKVQDNVWKVTLPNSFFGGFNPFNDLIRGDWFTGKGRDHHTGAVYLNGEWLAEAARLDQVLGTNAPAATASDGDGQYLLNVAWFRPGPTNRPAARMPAASFAAQQGVQAAPCSEGGECIGWIEAGDWACYERVDFGTRAEQVEIRAASVTEGGVIELRLNSAEGELLGRCKVTNTGDWQNWASFIAPIKPISGVQTLCLAFKANTAPGKSPLANLPLWFAQVDDSSTTIWAQFKGVNPNQQLVEVNARRTVLYPDQPGRNFITVRGFVLQHAATPWAPPTAEQIGLVGTHWSKGWIIEDNIVSHSICSGIALGKHGDQFDNTSANTAEGYVKTIERGHAHPIAWARANIGHHVVRNNTISHCEQAGIVGSLGAAFCTVTGNHIHDIHVRRLFTGAEMAGIKFHGAIDTTIRGNRIHHTCLGLWLDWMAQGTRVSQNLFYQNAGQDLFVEVDHGPFVVDNNLFLSPVNVLDMSQGGAYAHNLFAGKITNRPEPSRETPFHPAHSTTVAGLRTITGGDDRFFNNVFIGNGETPNRPPAGKELQWISSAGLWGYDVREWPLFTGGNVYANGALPYARETDALVLANRIPRPQWEETDEHVTLQIQLGPELKQARTARVTTHRLGRAKVPDLPYENPDGSPVVIDRDYSGRKRSASQPMPGPFESVQPGSTKLKVW